MFLAHVYFKTSYVDIKHPQTLHLVGQLCISKHHMLILNLTILLPVGIGLNFKTSYVDIKLVSCCRSPF